MPEGCFHRLGGGKPLGFGSVRLELTGIDVRDGASWADEYRSAFAEHASGCTDEEAAGLHVTLQRAEQSLVSPFRRAIEKTYGSGSSFGHVRQPDRPIISAETAHRAEIDGKARP